MQDKIIELLYGLSYQELVSLCEEFEFHRVGGLNLRSLVWTLKFWCDAQGQEEHLLARVISLARVPQG